MPIEYEPDDWKDGLACAECGHVFREKEHYSELLEGFIDAMPVVLIVCVRCALRNHA